MQSSRLLMASIKSLCVFYSILCMACVSPAHYCGGSSLNTCPNVEYKDTVLMGCGCLQKESQESSNFEEPSCKPSNLVDIVIMVEYSHSFNQYNVHSLVKGLRTLATKLKSGHCIMNTQATFLLYNLYEPKFLFARDLTPITNDSVEFEKLVKIFLVELYSKLSPVGNMPELDNPMEYVAVERSIEMAVKVMNREELMMDNGRSLQLHHRPHADLHIVTFLDMYAAHSQQTSKDNDSIFGRNIESKMSSFISSIQSLDKPIAFHFFLSPSNKVAVHHLGSPALSVRYSDCTHFNKALTLKALIGAGEEQASSLQAYVLAEGVEMQVQTMDDFSRPECVLAIIPNFWSMFGLRPTFIDECTPKSCRNGFYCSALHGCVKRTAKNATPLFLFEGKVPISVEFSSSHADLVKSSRNVRENGSNDVGLPLERLSITKHPVNQDTFNLASIVTGKPKHLQWEPEKPFIEEILGKGKPVVLRNTVIQTWSALTKWNLTYLAANMRTESLEAVKCTNSFVTFDPDRRTPLKLNISLPFVEANMTTESFFKCIQEPEVCQDGFLGHYYFGTVPESLKKDVKPDRLLYNSQRDYETNKQFMWISSSGMITHTHFDQDFNIFVQLVGSKRFTLWSPSQHEYLYVYPRVHPLWHKSRVNPHHPDPVKFRHFSRSKALQVELGPGDMLFVPPYTWHYVETLTPSVSLSTWSHDYALYDHMNAIYRHDHKFDLLESPKGQMFALRLFLDLMVHHLYGFNETSQFFARLLANRFAGLEHLFPASENDPEICTAAVPDKIPTCIHIHGYAKLDMTIIGNHFEALSPEVRDILFQDYVEEITAQVVGVKKMLAFFRYCFLQQEYYVTQLDDEEHLLWDHKDTE